MKIVVLDDSVTMRIIIESFLEDLGVSDDEIFLFDNGYKALDFIKKNGADIVFSDINMPYMSGFEFAEIVFKVHPHLKKSFFAISGEEGRASYLKMKKIGVHHFMKKPIKAEYFRHFVMPELLKLRVKST